jgi:hypothetical protein
MLSQLERGHHVGPWTRSVALRINLTKSKDCLTTLFQVTTHLRSLSITGYFGPKLIPTVFGAAAHSMRVLKIVLHFGPSEEDRALCLGLICNFISLEELSIVSGTGHICDPHTHPIDSVAPYQMTQLRSLRWCSLGPSPHATPFVQLLARSAFPKLHLLRIGMRTPEDHIFPLLVTFIKNHHSIRQVYWFLPAECHMEMMTLATSADFLAFPNASHLPCGADFARLSPSVRVIAISGPSTRSPLYESQLIKLCRSVVNLSNAPDFVSLQEIRISLGESPFRWRDLTTSLHVTPMMCETLRESVALMADRGLTFVDADGFTLDATESPLLEQDNRIHAVYNREQASFPIHSL